MGRKLEPYSITSMRNIDKTLNYFNRGVDSSYKKTIKNEIAELKKELLIKMKRDLPISETNHIIDVIKHNEDTGKAKLYFHVYNMECEEECSEQQDCYGTINEKGEVELYVSKELVRVYKKERKNEKPYSRYSGKEKERINEIKNIIKHESERIEKEDSEWYSKSTIKKLFAKAMGKKPKTNQELKDFLLQIPEKLNGVSDKFRDSLKVTESQNVKTQKESNEIQSNHKHEIDLN
ncbi:MAG: hypothetical protein IJ690_00155 [Clostridia bacterium]|nr:hypothetical protein [Clostridia bacterium]